MKRFLIPVALFFGLVVFLAIGLKLNPREVPSPLINKPVPNFSLPQLDQVSQTIGNEQMRGQVWMLNVWASWCVACRQEHPLVIEFSKQKIVPVIGLNYRDNRDDGLAWLKEFGDPYMVSAFDEKGLVGIDFGVYGVPETFLIDKQGIIRFKQIGPMTPKVIEEKLLPLIAELNKKT
jgi:cytochrome c biogenesis protein CcmG/thiol:disulfide interchange protein DsbE